jgi:hypothetical protein
MTEQEFSRLPEHEQNKILADLRKQRKSAEFGDRVSQLPLAQRLQIIDELRREYDALRAERITPEPAPAPIDDDTALVDAGELATLRKMWGNDEPEFVTPQPLQPKFKAKSRKHSAARFLLLQLDTPADLLWDRTWTYAQLEGRGYLWSVTAKRWLKVVTP